jgi:DNA-binding MarR family transcriptional regulator
MDTTARELLLEVRRLAQAAQEAQAQVLEEMGLPPLQRRLLDLLATDAAPVTASQLARSMLYPCATLEPCLRALQERDWIVDHAGSASSRPCYALTRAGLAMQRRVKHAERRLEEMLAGGLDREDAGRAMEMLRKTRRRFESVRQLPRLRPRPGRPDSALADDPEPAPRRGATLAWADASAA